MAYDHDAAQRQYRLFKTALTRALNKANRSTDKRDWQGVLREARRFRDYYRTSAEPMPDFWARWQRAADDAYFNLQRAGIEVERVDLD